VSAPRLKPGVRLHRDRVRGRDVLLAPERVVALDETAFAVLKLIDGETSLSAIAAALAAEYDADANEIEADAAALIGDLALKGYVSP